MKIPVKLKRDELLELVELLEKTIKTEEVSNRTEAIITTLVVKLYIILKKRSILIDKPSITFSIEPEIAMAFVEFFVGYPINQATISGNTIIRLIGLFDKQTARFY